MVFWQGGPALPITWYFCPDNAKIFPHVHAFGDGLFDSDKNYVPVIGEQERPPQPWYNGKNAWGYKGQCFVGTKEEFANGLTVESFNRPKSNPPCCRDAFDILQDGQAEVVVEAEGIINASFPNDSTVDIQVEAEADVHTKYSVNGEVGILITATSCTANTRYWEGTTDIIVGAESIVHFNGNINGNETVIEVDVESIVHGVINGVSTWLIARNADIIIGADTVVGDTADGPPWDRDVETGIIVTADAEILFEGGGGGSGECIGSTETLVMYIATAHCPCVDLEWYTLNNVSEDLWTTGSVTECGCSSAGYTLQCIDGVYKLTAAGCGGLSAGTYDPDTQDTDPFSLTYTVLLDEGVCGEAGTASVTIVPEV